VIGGHCVNGLDCMISGREGRQVGSDRASKGVDKTIVVRVDTAAAARMRASRA
jgi:hypothetical protein